MKKFFCFNKTNTLIKKSSKLTILGYIYIISLGLTSVCKCFYILPNLFGAQTWSKPGLEWTTTLTFINEKLFTFLVIICPMLIYYHIGHSVETVTFKIKNK